MRCQFETDQLLARQALLRKAAAEAEAVTPLHSASEAALGTHSEQDEDMQRRRRLQHQADPYPPEAPHVETADLGKLYRDAVSTPSGYPDFGFVNPEQFRRGPITAGESAYSPGYDPSARPVPIPSGTLSAAAGARPLLTDGQSRACAPGGQ
jgi:hypothetical protein